MKVELRIPTEQFAYIGLELASGEVLTDEMLDTVVNDHKRAIEAYKASNNVVVGLPKKEYDRCLDEFLKTGTLTDGADLYQQMNAEQQNVFQAIKRSLKRINNKE